MAYNAISTTTDELLSTDGNLIFDEKTKRFLLALSYWVIFATGLAGNGLVIFAVLRFRKLRTVTNTFVVNLAVSDFIGCFLLPPTTVSYVAGDLPLSNSFCGVMVGAIHVMFGASVSNLALISVNRYVLIVHPKVRYLRFYKKQNVLLMIITSWIYSVIIVCLPPIIGIGDLGYSKENRVCGIDTKHPLDLHYTAIRSILGLTPCLTVAIACYVSIFWFVRKTGRNRRKLFRGSNRIASGKRPIDTLQLNVTRNLSITMCAYITLVGSYMLIYLISSLRSLREWASVCVTVNSCVNPIIYGYGHPHFKEAFHSIFKNISLERTLRPVLFWRRRLPPDQSAHPDPTSPNPADERGSNTVTTSTL